ncbi:MAG: hypothetical protein A3E25_12840 [Burkholderiales bacterium RIFCSPHIGHO2_12_FULL_69_20]|nr:MAG: hypothetical protein A3E25_12840 [Burkholderiales bacterium RIFCSPHIGHO2_12_FULL_69_20]
MNILQRQVNYEVNDLWRRHVLRVLDVSSEIVADEVTEGLIQNIKRLTRVAELKRRIDALPDQPDQLCSKTLVAIAQGKFWFRAEN